MQATTVTPESRREAGLSDEEVVRSRREHGENTLTRQKGKSLLRRFLGNLNDPVIRILLCALAVNLLLIFRGGDVMESVGIGIAVFLATMISTLSEYNSARAFEALSEEGNSKTCRCRRNGTVVSLPVTEAVVGDVILLSAGERIPADGRLIRGEITTDQSAMTGESREIRKIPSGGPSADPAAPSSLFRGCTVNSGSGEMLVTAVGDASFLGGISREIQMERRDSPLKLRLAKLAGQISRLGYVAAVLVAFAYLFNVFVLDSGMRRELILLKITDVNYLLSQLFHAFTLGLTVIVVAVPEGLPMMVAVVLSTNVRKMMRDRVLIRKPAGIEAAGSMNLLLTDKTGTLTEGKMKVTSLFLPDGVYSVRDGYRDGGVPAEWMALAFRYGCDAVLGTGEGGRKTVIGGSATERALLSSVADLPEPAGFCAVCRLQFDSDRKYSAVTLRGKRNPTFVFGAPERIFPAVTSELTKDGKTVSFRRRETLARLRELTGKGNRVLAVAVTEESVPATAFAREIPVSLCFVGAVCINDPLRREARRSVADLRGAGIHVVMITGDHPETAKSIAGQCGILAGETDTVVTGEELSRLSDEELKALLPRLAVVARALPSDKSRLVRVSQECGLVVGMTGDGINDAPALRRADVGFAMGSGTQVAKDAGDVIILDNNLASIVKAVLYGRTVFKSIRKFITLQLTMNFCAVGVTMICPFLGFESPVTVVQMLWINVIMDTLGGLAFAGEAALPDCMRERPKRRDEPILNRYMVNEIVLHGGFTVGLCLYFLKSARVTSAFRPAPDHLYLLTAFFALFIFSSVFNCFNARTDRLNLFAGLGKNPVFIGIMTAILAIQLAFVYLGGSVLRTAPLTVRELLITMLLSLSVFPAEILRKALWRLIGKRDGY